MCLIQYPSSLKLVDMKLQMSSLPQHSELFQSPFYFSALLFSDVHHQTSGDGSLVGQSRKTQNLGREAGQRNRDAFLFWHAAFFLIISISLCIRIFKLFCIYFPTSGLPFLSLGQNCDNGMRINEVALNSTCYAIVGVTH